MSSSIRPKICLSFDHNHYDANEQKINVFLENLNPKEKIIYFAECRVMELEKWGQYSIELLPKDSKYSTGSAVNLLISKILFDVGLEEKNNVLLESLSNMLMIIYCDPYLKKLFMEDHYLSYTPKKYLNITESLAKKFRFLADAMSENDRQIIELIKKVFNALDVKLPTFTEDKQFFFFHMLVTEWTKNLIENKAGFDFTAIPPLCEALAVLKIFQIQKKLGDDFDKSREITLDFIRECWYSDLNPVDNTTLLNKIAIQKRTPFQIEKIEKVVKKIMESPEYSEDVIFVARVGEGHQNLLVDGLHSIYGKECVRIVELSKGPVEDVLKVVREAHDD